MLSGEIPHVSQSVINDNETRAHLQNPLFWADLDVEAPYQITVMRESPS
jgi:hypothetical protein